MSSTPELDQTLRDRILARPEDIIEDRDIMGALIAANDKAMGSNIVDLRGVAMERLEARLDRLEDAHRTVIAAAYENVAGTNLIHRATLRLLEEETFDGFLRALGSDVAKTLDVDFIKLVVETVRHEEEDPNIRRLGEVLKIVKPGFVADYIEGPRSSAERRVVLRHLSQAPERLYGSQAAAMRSEACLRLDFGSERLPGLLVLGSIDDDQFSPSQGTELLGFFGGMIERSMRRFLT
ncbi:DUF484 family protein [Pseudooceanicola algae]|uniref:Recombinase XerC n=1 Tax=Pseudooceanicola algae TaxID=1537215 RepID=A0A418SGN3_9RHOB|nr:DUF484 family protein [Pseudooceanicola algae]QPM88916.1 hypothetical protein PSAL_001190 [Pseudooceanicola algae]